MTAFARLLNFLAAQSSEAGFRTLSDRLEDFIFGLPSRDIVSLVAQIGTIPEEIPHDSSEEKLYAKCADILLARAFRELGLRSDVNRERANCADVVARSEMHGYSLVGDAKAFRLSRTAKNQKDFKVRSMVDWRGDHDYAVLVCPYYHYPRTASQIYGQALDGNVLLFSWEHLALLLHAEISEGAGLNLGRLWNLSSQLAGRTSISDRNMAFLDAQNDLVCDVLNLGQSHMRRHFAKCGKMIAKRGEEAIAYWERRIEEVKGMSREEAVATLLEAMKLNERIAAIKQFLSHLGRA